MHETPVCAACRFLAQPLWMGGYNSKNMKKTLIAVLGIGMMFTACKKEDIAPVPTNPGTPNNPPALTLRQKIMAQPWQVIAWSARPAADTTQVVDFYEYFVEDCSRDDRFYFMGGDSLRISEHTVVCDGGIPNTYGQWNFNETSRQIAFDFMGEGIAGNVSMRGDTAMALSFPFDFFGEQFTSTLVFRKR